MDLQKHYEKNSEKKGRMIYGWADPSYLPIYQNTHLEEATWKN